VSRAGRILRWLPLAATSTALLTWSNVVVPALPPQPVLRSAANLTATAVLLVAARRGGITWTELGLSRRTAGCGARWGTVALIVATVGYGSALAVPALRELLAGTASGEPAGTVLVRMAVLVPLGTVLCEEIAFRGVLLALARRQAAARTAVVIVSAVFGLWHVTSARSPFGVTGPSTDAVAPVVAVVALTAVGGLLFGWLRLRSGSLLAPIGLHLGTNGVGLAAVLVADRLTAG
jgi:membrane protease YdiL (CAAX protease family)